MFVAGDSAAQSFTPVNAVWSFLKADAPGANAAAFDDSEWSHVTLPIVSTRATATMTAAVIADRRGIEPGSRCEARPDCARAEPRNDRAEFCQTS